MWRLILYCIIFFAFQARAVSKAPDVETYSVDLEILHETSAYFRPSDSSRVFCGFQPGDVIQIAAQSENGWMGFDPGVAQASNTGVFRYRWIKNDSCVNLKGFSEHLLRMPSPDPFLTYNMFFGGTKIYCEPDSFSPPLYMTLNGDYAVIAGNTEGDWIHVEFSEGFPKIDVEGWIQSSFLNLSF